MRIALIVLVVIGLIIRFVSQFIFPAFNVDEIALGTNIKTHSYFQLLFPFENYQSAPPLFLLSQKLVISNLPFSFWINAKVLNFLASLGGLYAFYLFVIKFKINPWIKFLILSIFVFNPFIIGSSLTLKQYSFDLLGICLLLHFYNHNTLKKHIWIFFMIWCLFSNIGLFGCAGYLIYLFVTKEIKIKFGDIFLFLKSHILVVLAPIPYVIYFLWYMQQDGALELKNYMTTYWSDTFIPLDLGIFEHLAYLVHGFWIYFYSAYELWGLFLFMLSSILIFKWLKKKDFIFKNELILLIFILSMHIVLNLLRLYPLADRLYLYLAPFFIFALGGAVDEIIKIKVFKNYKPIVIVLMATITVSLYATNITRRNNDVPQLNENIFKIDHSETIYLTSRAYKKINSFNEFTEQEFSCNCKTKLLPADLEEVNYVVSAVHEKFKPGEAYKYEAVIDSLLKIGRIHLVYKSSGYHIFKINKL